MGVSIDREACIEMGTLAEKYCSGPMKCAQPREIFVLCEHGDGTEAITHLLPPYHIHRPDNAYLGV